MEKFSFSGSPRLWQFSRHALSRFFAKPVLLLVTLLFVSANSHAEWVEWLANANAQVQYDDNLNRSGFSEDKKDDTSLKAQGNFGRANQINSTLRATITGDLEANIFSDFDKLNSVSLGGTAALRKKLGLGLTVPWLRFAVSAAYLKVDDNLRSGVNLLADLQFGKRFSERFDMVAGVRLAERQGKSGDKYVPSHRRRCV